MRLVPPLAARDLERPARPSVRVALADDPEALALAGRRIGARPRIRPGSIRTEPLTPMEGETIFVFAEVENAGDAASRAATVTLYDVDPASGGEPAPNMLNDLALRVPALGPVKRRLICYSKKFGLRRFADKLEQKVPWLAFAIALPNSSQRVKMRTGRPTEGRCPKQ